MTPPTADRAFKAFRQFNDPELAHLAGVRARLDPRAHALFPSESLPDKIVRELADRRAIGVKEVFESFEFFERVRRRTRAPHVADLCCGHGLTGLLFAAFERTVERVTLVDLHRPPSHDAVLEAVNAVAPWTAAKVEYVEARVQGCARLLPPGTSIVAIHACGARTDRCLDVAIEVAGDLAVMPCCYFRTADRAPRALRDALGAEVATDVDRTYRLEAAGYRVEWTGVPGVITEMSRVLVGVRR